MRPGERAPLRVEGLCGPHTSYVVTGFRVEGLWYSPDIRTMSRPIDAELLEVIKEQFASIWLRKGVTARRIWQELKRTWPTITTQQVNRVLYHNDRWFIPSFCEEGAPLWCARSEPYESPRERIRVQGCDRYHSAQREFITQALRKALAQIEARTGRRFAVTIEPCDAAAEMKEDPA